MVAETKPPFISLEDYFDREARAEIKSEYFDGVLVAMAGASPAHVRITTNLTRLIGNQLEGRPCEPFDSDLRVYVEACNTVFYPDLTAACAPPQFAETRLATLLNPTLIIEVLSDTTEAVDRGFKFACFQSLESLQTYVLIAQDRLPVECFTRQPDGSWRYEATNTPEAVVALPAIGCELRLAEVYARIKFSATEAADAPS